MEDKALSVHAQYSSLDVHSEGGKKILEEALLTKQSRVHGSEAAAWLEV